MDIDVYDACVRNETAADMPDINLITVNPAYICGDTQLAKGQT